MHKVSQIVIFRNRRYARDNRRPWLKLGLSMAVILSLVFVTLSFLAITYSVSLTSGLPSMTVVHSLLEPPDGSILQPTRLLDRSGSHVLISLIDPPAAGKQFLYVAPDGQVGVDQATSYLVNAVILEFDPDFWINPGFKLEGITTGIHPTIAQELVTDLVLYSEPSSLSRNVRERILAAQLISEFGRQKVLEWYLNSARFGGLVFGADAAARVYFGKPAAKLSFAESAMLVAIAEKPSVDPFSGSQLLKQQQELIIQKMLVKGLVTGIEVQQALKETVRLQAKTEPQSVAPGFTGLVLDQLSTFIPIESLYRGGYEVITTLDFSLFAQVDCVVKAELAESNGNPAPAIALDGKVCESASLLPPLADGEILPATMSEIDIVVVDPRTGQVLVLTGGGGSGSIPSLPAVHPGGTILSPFLYLTAFTRGMSPASLIWDVPISNDGILDKTATGVPANDVANSYHGAVSLRQAMINDYQGAASQVLKQVGAKNVLSTEEQFGIITSLPVNLPGLSIFDLTSQDISLLDVVRAYAVVANQGDMAGVDENQAGQSSDQIGLNLCSILAVRSADGQVTLDWSEPRSIPVVSPQLAYLVTHVLSNRNAVLDPQGYSSALEIDRPVAIKSSLSHDRKNAWVVGYTPQLAVGVWMGLPEKDPGQIPDEAATNLWHGVMSYTSSPLPIEPFVVPDGIEHLQVCEPSGLLPTPLCPSIVQEVFLDGTQPDQVDNLYKRYSIDRETGYLATVFTPPDLVEDKVFLSVPAEMQALAKTYGLVVPPDRYDNISIPPAPSSAVEISSPQTFDQVRGNVEITGSAGGGDFLYYRLEVGKGLNPHEWLQIGEDVDHPVSNALLGSWDTSTLNGLYVIKLMVVRSDMRFDETFLEVTVDNTPPEIEISTPVDGEVYVYQPGKIILLSVSAQDDLVIDRVEYYINGSLVSSDQESPYVLVWHAQVGSYILSVRAYDLAGNFNQVQASFEIKK